MKLNKRDLEREIYTKNLPKIERDKYGDESFLYPVWKMEVPLVCHGGAYEDGAYFIYRILGKEMYASKINKYTRDPDYDKNAEARIVVKDGKMISFEPFEIISTLTDRRALVRFERHSAEQNYHSINPNF